MTRTKRRTPTLKRPFTPKGLEIQLPPNGYEFITGEELFERLSFPLYRCVAS